MGVSYESLVEELAADKIGRFREDVEVSWVSPTTGLPGKCVPYRYKRGFTHGQRYPAGWSSHLEVHPGVDTIAPLGSSVFAAADGVVLRAAIGGGTWGGLIIIGHDNGFVSRYGHVIDMEIRPGQEVSAGTKLGGVGGPPHFVAHLHFEIVSRKLYEVSYWDWWDGRMKDWSRNQSFYLDPEIEIGG